MDYRLPCSSSEENFGRGSALDVYLAAGIIDEERKIKHRKLSERIEEVITKPEKINLKLKSESVDIAYPPVVQSGGNYDLKYNFRS